jgi:hypothetical protein
VGATLRATRTASVAGAVLIAAAAVVQGVGPTMTVPSAAQAEGGDLVDRFLDVVQAVPTIQPGDVLVAEFDLEVQFLGDHIGDHAALEAVHDDAQSLFIAGDDAKSPVGTLIASGARAVMLIEDGYRRLAEFELTVPLRTLDELEVAVGTDQPRNLRNQGIDLVQEGQYRLETTLVGMRELDLTQEQATRYQGAVSKALQFAMIADPALRDLSRDTTASQIRTVSRFNPDIAGTAAARWAEYLCIPRGSADALSNAALAAAITATLDAGQTADCPDLPNPEVLAPGQIPAT